ncbi:ABC transporter ATP-binding protein [Streptomyces somaliensis DSM 40738]|uniref:ABC transporter ATP-binding protein n=1 Tax=Streptomyces somaliensis (strain ATCC 33201 / DSM 40738 / JCM 12659 / KCTC 9044 / NCTC 11332 / NRRL B-12077 / IP 733) TaxID=1134445 RepID=A0AA44DFU7_STRE0|nr:ABC transporter ATP-binding protein [Streptomyces somaliensis]MCQ0023340.1 ABC transporter ATP-binding protein [Streptomyces somaliensis DSM 40738]NKY16037.1 ABC transporter ATP-binding protein [Streptomyces somaliensis DSM 40738]
MRTAVSTTPGAGGPDEPVLRLEGVHKVYGTGETRHVALDGVTADFHAAGLTALVGHSGSGKSTLLNVSGGLEQATSGTITLAGHVLTKMGPAELTRTRASLVSYVFQEYNLIRTMTVLENVCLPLELSGMARAEARRRATTALERTGVPRHTRKFPDQLSGGEQQRVAIARAIADQRPLVLADEPTGALDSANGERVVELLREVTAGGVACVIATHNPDVTAAADHIVRIQDGRIVEGGA